MQCIIKNMKKIKQRDFQINFYKWNKYPEQVVILGKGEEVIGIYESMEYLNKKDNN